MGSNKQESQEKDLDELPKGGSEQNINEDIIGLLKFSRDNVSNQQRPDGTSLERSVEDGRNSYKIMSAPDATGKKSEILRMESEHTPAAMGMPEIRTQRFFVQGNPEPIVISRADGNKNFEHASVKFPDGTSQTLTNDGKGNRSLTGTYKVPNFETGKIEDFKVDSKSLNGKAPEFSINGKAVTDPAMIERMNQAFKESFALANASYDADHTKENRTHGNQDLEDQALKDALELIAKDHILKKMEQITSSGSKPSYEACIARLPEPGAPEPINVACSLKIPEPGSPEPTNVACSLKIPEPGTPEPIATACSKKIPQKILLDDIKVGAGQPPKDSNSLLDQLKPGLRNPFPVNEACVAKLPKPGSPEPVHEACVAKIPLPSTPEPVHEACVAKIPETGSPEIGKAMLYDRPESEMSSEKATPILGRGAETAGKMERPANLDPEKLSKEIENLKKK